MGSTDSNTDEPLSASAKDAADKKDKDEDEPVFLNYCFLTQDEMRSMAQGSAELRASYTRPVSTVTKEQVLAEQSMSFLEEACCLFFLAFGVPVGVFSIPTVLYLIGKFIVGSHKLVWTMFVVFMLPLVVLPQVFVPSLLQSWMAWLVHKYFSFKFIMELHPNADSTQRSPQIFVAPPHGVFPYGNILSMLMFPSLVGYPMRALASSAALRPPIFKQILLSIGIVDASRETARKMLTEDKEKCIGISTGGVAEVFETNADHETIVLKERKGLVKLAIRTGAELVPCYLFGNTKIMSSWHGEGIPVLPGILEKISRKLGFATICIFGRWGLPLPKRIPILGVMGTPIPTAHMQCEDPTPEQVDKIQEALLKEMQELFERYKKLYGWDEVDLIIK